MDPDKSFIEAASVYSYLTAKGFDGRSCKKFVGDHYSLSGTERSILFRGISKPARSGLIRSKLIPEKEIKNRVLHIDSLNVMITLISYLKGRPVYLSTDGLLRDASETHGKTLSEPLVEKAVKLSLDYLGTLHPAGINFYIDKPVNNSKRIVGLIREILLQGRQSGEVEYFDDPDKILRMIRSGYVATSDSVLIERTEAGIFDLARHTLDHHFQPKYLDLQVLIPG